MTQLVFQPAGYFNGQPTWIATDGNGNVYQIYWDPAGYWVMLGWPYGGEPRNNTPPPSFPTSGWYIFGSSNQVTFDVNEGDCTTPTPVPTQTLFPTPSPTPPPTPTPPPSPSPTPFIPPPTSTLTPTVTPTPTLTQPPTPTPSTTETPTPTPTPSPTPIPPCFCYKINKYQETINPGLCYYNFTKCDGTVVTNYSPFYNSEEYCIKTSSITTGPFCNFNNSGIPCNSDFDCNPNPPTPTPVLNCNCVQITNITNQNIDVYYIKCDGFGDTVTVSGSQSTFVCTVSIRSLNGINLTTLGPCTQTSPNVYECLVPTPTPVPDCVCFNISISGDTGCQLTIPQCKLGVLYNIIYNIKGYYTNTFCGVATGISYTSQCTLISLNIGSPCFTGGVFDCQPTPTPGPTLIPDPTPTPTPTIDPLCIHVDLGLQRCVSEYYEPQRHWGAGGPVYTFIIRNLTINGIQYGSNQTLVVNYPGGITVGSSIINPAVIYVTNVTNWINGIIPPSQNLTFYDNMLVVDKPVTSTYTIEIESYDNNNTSLNGYFLYTEQGNGVTSIVPSNPSEYPIISRFSVCTYI